MLHLGGALLDEQVRHQALALQVVDRAGRPSVLAVLQQAGLAASRQLSARIATGRVTMAAVQAPVDFVNRSWRPAVAGDASMLLVCSRRCLQETPDAGVVQAAGKRCELRGWPPRWLQS